MASEEIERLLRSSNIKLITTTTDANDEFSFGSDTFDCLGVIGKGGEATVFKARKKPMFGAPKPSSTHSPSLSLEELYAIRYQPNIQPNQLNILTQLAGPATNGGLFVKVLGMHPVFDAATGRTDLWSVMPLYGNDLYRMSNDGNCLLRNESHLRWIAALLLSSLNVLHSAGYAHRDLSGGNVLFTNATDDTTLNPKVGDFGLAVRAPLGSTIKTEFVGTMAYWSPELLLRCKSYDPHKADIWAVGIILHHLMTGFLYVWQPNTFTRDGHAHIESHVRHLQYTFTHLAKFDKTDFVGGNIELVNHINHLVGDGTGVLKWMTRNYSKDAQDFLSCLLEPNPERRPSAAQLLSHKFLLPITNPLLF